MRMRPWLLLVFACASAPGCSKTVAPRVTPDQTAAGASLAAREVGSPPSDQIQVEVDGNLVTIDDALRVHVDPHARFFVTPGGRDTVPSFGVLKRVLWPHAEVGPARGDAAADAGSISPPIGTVLRPGAHPILQLQLPPRLGGGTMTLRIYADLPPDEWWAGPEPERWPISSDGDGRSVDVVDWRHFTTVPPWPPDGRPYFGPDSFAYLPSQRRPAGGDVQRQTFYEIYGDRIYARSEGDTVHLNSWVVFWNGGYDKDSKYQPKVDPSDPALPPGFAAAPQLYPVLDSLGLVGSPIGFRSALTVRDSLGYTQFAPSGLYPVLRPASVIRLPMIGGYWRMSVAGRAYVVVRAEDGDELVDSSVPGDPTQLVNDVEAGTATPAEVTYRRKVVTFYVR